MTDKLEIVTVPRDLYYLEIAYVRGLEAEIERLRAENQEAWNKLELSEERERKLRAALQEIKTKCGDPRIVSDIARRALETKP